MSVNRSHYDAGFPELDELFEIVALLEPYARVEVVAEVHAKDKTFPIITICLGPNDPTVPTVGFFGGVHGLERIGTRVLLSYLRTIGELLKWDKATQNLFTFSRMVFLPLINPAGMYFQSRSNANGVDLMRNSPVRAEGMSKYKIFGGHRFSAKLPWYQGPEGAAMEVESQAVCDFVRKELTPSPVSIALDVHSGFGSIDRLWFPYAKTQQPFPHVAEMAGLKRLLDQTYPNHVYAMEPQSQQYVTHGDLWDFLYDESLTKSSGRLFIPLTLELGSWMWVKKNMRQAFSLLGVFNPLAPHRQQRILRRHIALLDFLHRATISHDAWATLSESERESLRREGGELWYAA